MILPEDNLVQILDFLTPPAVVRLGMTCKSIFQTERKHEHLIWKHLFIRRWKGVTLDEFKGAKRHPSLGPKFMFYQCQTNYLFHWRGSFRTIENDLSTCLTLVKIYPNAKRVLFDVNEWSLDDDVSDVRIRQDQWISEILGIEKLTCSFEFRRRNAADPSRDDGEMRASLGDTTPQLNVILHPNEEMWEDYDANEKGTVQVHFIFPGGVILSEPLHRFGFYALDDNDNSWPCQSLPEFLKRNTLWAEADGTLLRPGPMRCVIDIEHPVED